MTANRGLRYPEGTAIGNTMHTRIKELAEDVDSQFQAVKVEVIGRQFHQQAHAGGQFTNSGSDFAFGQQTISIPTGTEIIEIHAGNHGSSSANAAAYFYLQVMNNAGTWISIATSRVHNNAVPATGLGACLTSTVGMNELGPVSSSQVRLIINVDASGSAIYLGPTHYTLVYKRVN